MHFLAAALLIGAAQSAPTATPTPQPWQRCDHGAIATYIAEPVGQYGMVGTSAVRLTIAPDGEITGAKTVQESGSAVVDASTFQAAIQSKFVPRTINCRPIASTIYFIAAYNGRGVSVRAGEGLIKESAASRR